ncbi:DUF4846 domain-containing protein [bacterium]|nr:DUF4846 domain-containing protein [bacterium]MDB4088282.1 DUF4846 domain-containing protein [Flavobacteriales bacterium]
MNPFLKLFLFSSLIIYLGCNTGVSNNEIDNSEEEFEIIAPTLVSEIELPKGFIRMKSNAYGEWIRNLKLDKENVVRYYNGEEKPNQSIHVAVLDFDIGTKDLQQCADACMRIRAEYLFQNNKMNEINFLLASGKWKSFSDYTSKVDKKNFRKYMNYIFSYANTASLKKQMKSISDFKTIEIGDVLVQSGNPYGHAVTVMDVCENVIGNKMFMLSQSYMPAQSIEILINPNSKDKSPWYSIEFEGDLVTPEWVFSKGDLKRF